MSNPSNPGFHPFGNPNQQHVSGAATTKQHTTPITTGHLNGVVQQGIIGHNSPMMNNLLNNNSRKSLLDSLHQPQPNNIPPTNSNLPPSTTPNGTMNGFQSSLFYNTPNPHMVNSNNNSILGGMNNYAHFVPPQQHTTNNTGSSLLNLSQQQQLQQPITNNPHVNNHDGFQLMGNNKLFAHAPNNNNNLGSNLLRNNGNNLSNSNLANSSPFGLSLLGSSTVSATTEPIGARSHVNMNGHNIGNTNNLHNTFNNGNINTSNTNGLHSGLVNNLNNSSSGSLLSSFHNDFGNRGTSFQQQPQYNLNLSMGNTNGAFGWNNNMGTGNNLGFSPNNGLMNNNNNSGGQLLMNNQVSPTVVGSNTGSFYSPFLSMNQASNSPSMGQQPHLPLFGNTATTTNNTTNVPGTHSDFFSSSSGQFGVFPHQQQTHQQPHNVGRNKSSNEVDFSYLTTSLPLDDDDNSFLSNQTTNPLFEDQSFQKAIQPSLFNPQQQGFSGLSPSSTNSSGNSNDNTTATPSPPPPQFLSSAPEYHNRVLAMASSSTQYTNPPQQSPSNFPFGSGGLPSLVSYGAVPTGANIPFMQPVRGNIPSESVISNQPHTPMNGQPSNMEQNDIKQTGKGHQYVFAPPPSSTSTHSSDQLKNTVNQTVLDNNISQAKKEVSEKIVNASPEVEKKETGKKKPEPVTQKSKSKKKNGKSAATTVVEAKPITESPKPVAKEEKSEQEKLDEELAKKLQREFELEYLRNLDNSSKPKNNSFTTSTSGKKKKVLEEVPDKIPLASSSTQSNSFSILESVPSEIQSSEKSAAKKQAQTQPVSTKNSKKNKNKKKNEPTPQPKKEDKNEKVEAEKEKVDSKSKTETKEEDYNKPCKDHFKGKCKFGSGICPYSHDRSFYIKYQQEHPDEFPPLTTSKSKKKEIVEVIPEPQAPLKKTEVCMKHSSIQSCGNGKNCKFLHLSDMSLHDLYRKCCTGHSDRICKCAPQNDLPILYIEGVTKLTKKQMQEINEKSFMKALGVFKMTEQNLYSHLPELKAERKHKRFLYIFPDTCVKLIISKIERSEANRVKKLFNETEEEDARKRQAELSGQRYDQEKDDESYPTWQITGLTSHQHCILRFVESMLPLCFVAPDCDSYGEGEPFDEAMYGHPVDNYDVLRLYPSTMERIFEMVAPDDESDEDLSKELLMMMLGKACEKKKAAASRANNERSDSNYQNLVNCIGPIVLDPNNNHH